MVKYSKHSQPISYNPVRLTNRCQIIPIVERYNLLVTFFPDMKYQKYAYIFAVILLFIAHSESFSQVTDKAKLLQFEEAITRGEEFLQAKDYAKAKAEYQKALAIDPSAKYPKDKLAQIRKVYIDPQDETDFQAAVQIGDRLFEEGNFSEAKEQYSIALTIKPDDKSVREKSVNTDKKATEKVAMLKEFDIVKAEADKLFDAKNYTQSIDKYKQAQLLNPKDTHTASRLHEAETILAKQKALDDNYNQIITEADDAYMNREFTTAKDKYAQASKLKPAESYPKSMLERVDESIKNKAVNDAEQEKQLAEKQKKDSLDAVLAAKAEQERLAEEARLKAEKDAEEARLLAEKKADDERIAQAKLLEEQRILAEKEAEEKRLAEEKSALERKLVEEKEAEDQRLAALAAEQHRQDSINAELAALELKKKQAEENRLSEEARLAEEARIAEQNRLAEEARQQDEAKALAAQKAEEERLAQEKLLEEARLEEARIAAEKEAEQKRLEYELASQIDKEYYDAIESANRLFSEEDFSSAIVLYEKASALKPLEDFPKDRLIYIRNLQLARLKYSLEAYNKNIAAGDLAYQSNIFDKAIEEYEKAMAARPEETYPGLMIDKIRKLMEDNAMINLVINSVILTDAGEEKYKFSSIDMKLRKNNYIIIKAKKTSEKAPKIFINYGKDDLKSGGIVVKSVESDETVDYLVRISSQDKWYRVDNNWISLYPEGGSIEITGLQISQGDIQKVP